jgi:hypothetical protein
MFPRERTIMKTQQSQIVQLGASSPPFLSLEPLDTIGKGNSGLFSDAVLPEQFYGSHRGSAATHGEVALMRAVLDDALRCYQGKVAPTTRHVHQLAKEAETWLLNDDERWPFSFVNVCRILGLEPDYIRRGLKQWDQHPSSVPYKTQRRLGPRGQRLRCAA